MSRGGGRVIHTTPTPLRTSDRPPDDGSWGRPPRAGRGMGGVGAATGMGGPRRRAPAGIGSGAVEGAAVLGACRPGVG
jgi:hypothetical protein